MNPLRHTVAAATARCAGWVSRTTGRGSGRAITGKVLITLAPASLQALSRGRRTVLVSGTNGKSTTAHLIAEAWRSVGPVTANSDGANLAGGIAAALLDTPHERVVLEVDEVALPDVLASTRPEVVVLLNLARDQLDRIGEVSQHVRSWREALSGGVVGHAVVNCDDPLLVAAVQGTRTPVTWVSAGLQWLDDARLCQRCARAVCFEDGDWWCTGCGLRRPAPAATVRGNLLVSSDGPALALDLQLPGPWNLANAGLAVVAARLVGVEPAAAVRRMAAVTDVNGRYAVGRIGGHEVRLLLAKNPASARSVLDLVGRDDAPVVLAMAAEAADGRDPSWLWDVPFESLRTRHVVVTGPRARDLSLRLRYAEVEHVVARELSGALLAAGPGPCHLVANYTAFTAASARLQDVA